MIFKLTTTLPWTSKSNYAAGDAKSVKIVRASGEQHAREIAAKHTGDEGSGAWLHDSTIVEAINPNGPPMELMP